MNHDCDLCLAGYGIYVGQNLAWGYDSWSIAIKAWHDEVNLFTYAGTNNNFGAVGHYTQVNDILPKKSNSQYFIDLSSKSWH